MIGRAGPGARPLIRTWLYVPGHRPERVAKALASGADAVVVDLEDAVPADRKEAARETVATLLAEPSRGDGPSLWVRVNDVNPAAGPDGERDLAALVSGAPPGRPPDGLRLPRCERPDVVRRVGDRAGLPLQLLLETAAGVAAARELAAAHPAVAGLGLGEADLGADLRVSADEGLDWARGWVVVAARAAGLPSPVQSVYPDVADLDGLRASTRRGRALGFLGRSVVHPRQIAVVHEVLTPSSAELDAALGVVRTAEEAMARGEVAVLGPDGRFVDPAVVDRARVLLDLAGEPRPGPPI